MLLVPVTLRWCLIVNKVMFPRNVSVLSLKWFWDILCIKRNCFKVCSYEWNIFMVETPLGLVRNGEAYYCK
jgi:hypothetical protein